MDWLDADSVEHGVRSLGFGLADGSVVEVDRLGQRFEECARVVRDLRGRARRAALTQSAMEPLRSFVAREPDRTVDVLLFRHALTIEPRDGTAVHLPLSLVRTVERDGWVFTLRGRGVPDVVVRGLGPRTDEFEQRLGSARTALREATAAAFASFDPALAGLDAPDGWAIGPSEAGQLWPTLLARWQDLRRGQEVRVLAGITADTDLRCGLWTEGGTVSMPFVLARCGQQDAARTAIEAVGSDDRATFIFATSDVERLSAALVLSAFRREALSLPEERLGTWAVAVRTQPHVRWARECLVARVVHDNSWEAGVRAALAAG